MSERQFDLSQFHVTIVPSLKDICSVFKYSLLFIPLRGFSYNQIHKSGGKKSLSRQVPDLGLGKYGYHDMTKKV